MGHRLFQVLSSNTTSNGSHEMFTMGPPKQSWKFSGAAVGNVFTNYCEYLSEGETEMTLAEFPGNEMPLVVYMSFKFTDSPSELITQDFIYMIISSIQQVMNNTLEINETAKYYCCVLSDEVDSPSPTYIEKSYRFQFPYIRVEKSYLNGNFRQQLIKNLRQKNLVKHLEEQPQEEWDKIISQSFITNPIPMYGSTNGIKKVPMFVSNIVGYIGDVEDWDEVEEMELRSIFIPSNHKFVCTGLITDDIINSKIHIQGLEFWLPLLFSMSYYQEVTHESPSSSPIDGDSFSLSDEPMIQSQELIRMMGSGRADSYSSWIDVGRALYITSEATKEGLALWTIFTEKRDTFTSDDCRKRWHGMKMNEIKVNISTLEWFARMDSPDIYKEWKNKKTGELIEKSFGLAHTDVATAVYELYKLEYVCASTTKKLWYRYIHHGWNKMDGDVYMDRLLTNQFCQKLNLIRRDLSDKACDVSLPEETRTVVDEMIKKVTTLISKLKNSSYKASILKEMKTLFYVDGFIEYLDSDKRFTRCVNGIIEVNEDVCEFREGKPQDYISKSTLIMFPTEMTEDDPAYKRLDYWIRQFFPDEETRNTFKKDLACILKGGNAEKRLRTLTGDGDNGKSVFINLLEMALGMYCVKISIESLTVSGKGGGSANPEIDQCRGARLVVTEEPDATEDKLKGGTIKKLTGNDNFFNRGLFQDGGKITPQFVLWLLCNTVPPMTAGRAEKQRLWLYPMKSTWTDDAPHSLDEQWKTRTFKMDTHFSDNLFELAPALLKVMTLWYPKYIREGIPMVGEVKEAIEDYWEMNDPYLAFTKTKIEVAEKNGVPDKDTKVSVSDVYGEFQMWYRNAFPSERMIPNLNIATTSLGSRWGKPVAGFWYGIRFKVEVVDLTNVFATII
jgi:phage/plasmid-associated DNA primase